MPKTAPEQVLPQGSGTDIPTTKNMHQKQKGKGMTDSIQREDISKVSGGSGSYSPKCPACGSMDCIFQKIKLKSDVAYIYRCNACGHSWKKIYETNNGSSDPGSTKQQ